MSKRNQIRANHDYIKQVIRELIDMAIANDEQFLSYLLEMAYIEAYGLETGQRIPSSSQLRLLNRKLASG